MNLAIDRTGCKSISGEMEESGIKVVGSGTSNGSVTGMRGSDIGIL